MNYDRRKDMFKIEENRIFLSDDAGKTIAEITFCETSPGTYTIDHTFVDSSLRGQGIASKLVDAAVKEILSRNCKVAATCSYAKKWLEEHPVAEG